MRTLLYLPLLLLPFHLNAQKTYTKAQILSDLDYMAEAYEASHFNLYAYTPKVVYQGHLQQLKNSLHQDSFDLREATNIFQSFAAKAENGHTEVPFPGQAYINYAYQGGTLFPLELAFEDHKVYVRKNWSSAPIPAGAILQSLNGRAIEDVLTDIYPLVSAERPYFKKAKIELLSFPRLFWQAFGRVDSFRVVLQMGDSLQSFTLDPVPLITGYEQKRSEVFYQGFSLDFYDQTAYLIPGSFGGDLDKYRRAIDSLFLKIAPYPHLIIDLRNNLGGDDAFSNYLVSYIAQEAFVWSKLQVKSSALLKESVRAHWDTTSRYAQSILNRPDGQSFAVQIDPMLSQGDEKRYKGEVYVLINRQSHSQAAVTAAQIQDYGWATLIGEETGEYADHLYASQLGFTLPQTQIEVKVSKGKMNRLQGGKLPAPVLPDIAVRDHLLDEDDEVLGKALEVINGMR